MEIIINGEKELKSLELVINENIGAFYRVGVALKQIRDSKLYKEVLGFETFEGYCRERWDMGRTYSFYQIESAQVIDNLSVHNCEQIPITESQTRPLTKLSPPLQIEAWTKTVETAPDGKVTARHVSKVVCELIGEEEKKTMKKIKRIVKDEMRMSEQFRTAFDEMIDAIILERAASWKDTSRTEVLRVFGSIRAILEGEKNV